MGYYVRIVNSTAVIPTEHLDEAYRRMCDLNTTHDHLKNGGAYAGGKQTERWFSWMDADYPSKCKNAKEILQALGFDMEENDEGLYFYGYDSKSGQEDLFIKSIADLMTGFIEWCGEEEERWMWEFSPAGIKTKVGRVVYE